MKIEYHKSWRTGPYCELVVTEGTCELRSRLLDDKEAAGLAEELREAADYLDRSEDG